MSDIIPNFVFKKNTKRPRKTYIKKQCLSDDINNEYEYSNDELSSANFSIETKVYQFMSQLHNKNMINNNLLMEEMSNAVTPNKSSCFPSNVSKHYYDNKRTMLVDSKEDTKLSPPSNAKDYMMPDYDIVDDDITLVTSVVYPNNNNNKTDNRIRKKKFHGKNNQIIRLNSNLKYQHDYDFLINNDLPLYSKLLNLINAICAESDNKGNDDSFKQYFLKWRLHEFLNYCLMHKDIETPKARYFMIFLLIKLNLPIDESLPLSTLLTKIISLSINDTFSITCTNDVNKLTRITLQTFLKTHNLERVTNHHLSIKLWSLYLNQLPQLVPYIRRLILKLDNREDGSIPVDPKYEIKERLFISNNIVQFSQSIMNDTDLNFCLLKWFINHWRIILYDKISVMAFIILTNNRELLSSLRVMEINEIVSKIISMKYEHFNEMDNTDILQLQICQFALCLNLIELIDNHIQIDEWDPIINKIIEKCIDRSNNNSNNFNIEENNNDNEYNLGLFVLILLSVEYHSQNGKYKTKDFKDRRKLIIFLEKFRLLTGDNIKISSNIDLILENTKQLSST